MMAMTMAISIQSPTQHPHSSNSSALLLLSHKHHNIDQNSNADQEQHQDQDQDQPPHQTILMEMPQDANSTASSSSSSEWMFLVTNLVLEIVSAVLDQLSSPPEPCYGLLGMLVSLLAAIICIAELLLKGLKEGIVLRRSTSSCSTRLTTITITMCCFYYPNNNSKLFGSFSDIYGLLCALSQFIFSAIKYIHHANDPVKLSVLPLLFLACLAGSKLITTETITPTSMEADLHTPAPNSPPQQNEVLESSINCE